MSPRNDVNIELPYDIQKIQSILPHRYPFLLLDRVISLIPHEKVIAYKNVTINEPFFQGHFPGKPIMPGVLVVEAMAQAGGILAIESQFQDKQKLIYIVSMDKVKFRKLVVPGDQIYFDIRLLKLKTKVIKMEGVATVDDKIVAEAQLMAFIGEKHDS